MRATPDQKRHRLIITAIQIVAIIALLGAINLFSWDGDLWFQWPTLGLLFLFAMRATIIYRH